MCLGVDAITPAPTPRLPAGARRPKPTHPQSRLSRRSHPPRPGQRFGNGPRTGPPRPARRNSLGSIGVPLSIVDSIAKNEFIIKSRYIFDIPEYADLDRAKNFVSLLERKDEFLKKLMDREDGTIVTIGGENADDFMNDCSVITATYHVDGQLIGKVGVIGPTRMKYGEVTSIVEYLTQNLNETFGLESGEDEDNGG